jgi:hypothetical protein
MRRIRKLTQLPIWGQGLHHSLHNGEAIAAAQVANWQTGNQRIHVHDTFIVENRFSMGGIAAAYPDVRKPLF